MKIAPIVGAVLVAWMAAGCGACGAKPSSGVLQPQMKPEAGTEQTPAAAIGEKPAAPWSATTIEAAVEGRPNAGEVREIAGEVIDCSCYWQLGKHGAKHKDCGQKCARSGEPLGLLTSDGTVYLLLAEEHHPRRDGQTTLREALIEKMASVVTVIGTVSTVNGQKALFVTGFVKK